MPQCVNCGASSQAAAITLRLSSTGVIAGTAKRFHELRMPADSATSDMQPMYGNISRVITTAESCASAGSPDAMIHTSTGEPTTPTTHTTTSAHISTVATASISVCVASSPAVVRDAARMGTKACENAPSAKRRRSRLGMRNATW